VAGGRQGRGADVEEETGEERDGEAERAFADREEPRQADADQRRGGVGDQPAARPALAAAARQAEGHRVDPVGDVVREHRRGHHDADRRRDLERQPDAKSVQQAVGGEAGGAEMTGAGPFRCGFGGGAERAL
jgi:hypothetical protein